MSNDRFDEGQDLEILNLNGRVLLGALVTRIGGFASVDRTMKRYVPAEVNPAWGEIAQQLQFCLQRQIDPRTIHIVEEEATSQPPQPDDPSPTTATVMPEVAAPTGGRPQLVVNHKKVKP